MLINKTLKAVLCTFSCVHQQIINITGAKSSAERADEPAEEHKCERQLSRQLYKEWLSSGKVLRKHTHTHSLSLAHCKVCYMHTEHLCIQGNTQEWPQGHELWPPRGRSCVMLSGWTNTVSHRCVMIAASAGPQRNTMAQGFSRDVSHHEQTTRAWGRKTHHCHVSSR